MGRPAKPTALRLLLGETRTSRINTDEPTPSMVELVRPKGLPVRARQEWDRIVPDLVRHGVATHWDQDALIDLVCLVAIREAAQQHIQQHGPVIVVLDRLLADGTEVFGTRRNPHWQVRREASQLLLSLRAKFGLTPSDRAGVRATPSPPVPGGPERLLS